ncbi:MAG TPA: HRDC domain-containing protein [Tepidisphaeraceae bacterium]|jgi:ribonuclease D|nr:HRDC domain-containing protein [Tepidisphaeraceae bacterium]
MSEGSAKKSEGRRKRNPRHDYRARSHESAHAQDEGKPVSIPELPLVPRNQPALLSTMDEVQELIEHLRAEGRFAYDSEFIGELTYHPKICVIQVATASRVALIDALAGLDLKPFWELIADPGLEKIVHAGQQDLEPVFRFLDRAPANIFDTQLGSGFVGLSYPAGLSKLVRELLGVHLGKGFTFTHWDHRPLTSVQLRYAADDVRYLPALHAAIVARLNELGHLHWAKEECAALCDPKLYRPDPAVEYTRLRGSNMLPPQGQAVLRELYIWREGASKRHDSPPRSYVRDEILLELARKPVTEVAGLARVRGLPRPVENEEGEAMVEAVKKGLALPEAERPKLVQGEESPRERFATDSLWATVQAWCHGKGIDPSLVTSRQEMARLLRHPNRNSNQANGRLLRGWRSELIGGPLGEFLKGDREIRVKWSGGRLKSDGGS